MIPPLSPSSILQLPVLASEALDFWFERVGRKLGEQIPGDALRKTWLTWVVPREPEPGAPVKKVKVKKDGSVKSKAFDALGRELHTRRLGSGVTGLILLDDHDAVIVERLSGAALDLWQSAGFRVIEPDGKHVLKGMLDWLGSSGRSSNCLAMQFGKAGVWDKLELCHPPHSFSICTPDKVVKFDPRKAFKTRDRIMDAGAVAVDGWREYARNLNRASVLANLMDDASSRHEMNQISVSLSKLKHLFPRDLPLPSPGTDAHLILGASFADDALALNAIDQPINNLGAFRVE